MKKNFSVVCERVKVKIKHVVLSVLSCVPTRSPAGLIKRMLLAFPCRM